MKFKRSLGAVAFSIMLTISNSVAIAPTEIEPIADSEFKPVLPYSTATPIPVIVDRFNIIERPTSRPKIETPVSKVVIVTESTPVPKVATTGRKLVGNASWYCRPGVSICTSGYPASGSYAAAGPKLREAICGDRDSRCYKGKTVYVDGKAVKLIDYCQCYWRKSNEKLIDLYYSVWSSINAKDGVVITW